MNELQVMCLMYVVIITLLIIGAVKEIREVIYDIFDLFIRERMGTGRIYFQNVDHTNEFSPFDTKKAPIRQSNLCLEIALPTVPQRYTDDPEAEIALCTLLAYNLGKLPLFNVEDNSKVDIATPPTVDLTA